MFWNWPKWPWFSKDWSEFLVKNDQTDFNGNFRILKRRYRTTFLAIFWGIFTEIQGLYMASTSNLGSWNGHWWFFSDVRIYEWVCKLEFDGHKMEKIHTHETPIVSWSLDLFLETMKHMGVSWNRGYPQIIQFNWISHYQPSILGVPTFMETSIWPGKERPKIQPPTGRSKHQVVVEWTILRPYRV